MPQNRPPFTDWLPADEHRVAIAGDWHGNRVWVRDALTRLCEQAPDVSVMLHSGDVGIWPDRSGKAFLRWVDQVCADTGIRHVLVTPGNHEDYHRLNLRFASHPGHSVQLSDVVWALPRGHRLKLGDRTMLSFGGAVSMDRHSRRQGRDWWPDEAPTDEDVDRAVDGGPVDVMVSHDSILRGTQQVQHIIDTSAGQWPDDVTADAEMSRLLVSTVWATVRPRVLVHGHFHVQGEIRFVDGRRVYSLAADGMAGNIGILNLTDLSWAWTP